MKFSGSLHIYLFDFGIDIRGMECHVKGSSIIVRFPTFKTQYEGKLVKFPIVEFTDPDVKANVIASIKIKLRSFIKSEMKGFKWP